MLLIIILVLIEALSLAVLRQHFYIVARTKYYIAIIVHIVLSIWFWVLLTEVTGNNSFFDTQSNIWGIMALAGMITAVILPRIILIVLHFTGRLIRRKSGGHIRWLTNTGLSLGAFIIIVICISTFYGRFNFKYEEVPITINNLHPDLEGIKIIQVSDLHLPAFYHHPHKLQNVIEKINSFKPDLIFNTGDFITIGWREFGRNDTILSKAKGTYGSFAIMGNHDAGTYHPEYTEADLENHRLIMNNLVKASGYKVLNNESVKVRIGDAVIGITGVTTKGRRRHIIHGNIDSAASALDSVDLSILLTHDPNHWTEEIAANHPEIQLCLSGHTHGMQMGILTKKLKWSPAQYIYPHWNGLYYSGGQAHYVNRGLGVLAIPFRIWMPPEITIITLHAGK
ncbi:MAG TPA: metallophosphoesterase [Bacteroidales bacterium]|nr:metallophosphoesterase [Bacteroidales bacterium]